MTAGEPSWQCGQCKQWIPYNQGHVCYTGVTGNPVKYYGQGYIDKSILERIAKALEDLVELKKEENK